MCLIVTVSGNSPYCNCLSIVAFTAFLAKSGPDIFYQIPDQIPQFASQGMLEPLNAYVSPEDLKDFSKASLEAASYNKTLYALPILRTGHVTFYNADVIQKIGEDPTKLPTTWEEFIKALAYIKEMYDKGWIPKDSISALTKRPNLLPLECWRKSGITPLCKLFRKRK